LLLVLSATPAMTATPMQMPAINVQPPAIVQIVPGAESVADVFASVSPEELNILYECSRAASAPASEFIVNYSLADGHTIHARPHAVERHGEIVLQARADFGNHDPRQRRNECPETNRAINLTPMSNGDWAVMIEELATGNELTCWTATSENIERIWLRLVAMHKCLPSAADKAAGHDFWSDEIH